LGEKDFVRFSDPTQKNGVTVLKKEKPLGREEL